MGETDPLSLGGDHHPCLYQCETLSLRLQGTFCQDVPEGQSYHSYTLLQLFPMYPVGSVFVPAAILRSVTNAPFRTDHRVREMVQEKELRHLPCIWLTCVSCWHYL